MTALASFLFHKLVVAHIATGTAGLITLWVPIIGRKGGETHRMWGTVFVYALLATGGIAIFIALCTLIAPLETHPFFDDVALVRGIFGWMMLYLAIMTIVLAWYGRLCIRNRRAHARNRTATNLALQGLMFLAALNCLVQGLLIDQVLMVGISVVGLAAGVLNTKFILTAEPPPQEWMIQHSRGVVGAGISVYTAFLAFGAVNLLPAFALHPVLWAIPCALGVAYLLYHQFRITRLRNRRAPLAA